MEKHAYPAQKRRRAIEVLESPDWLLHEINFYRQVCVFLRVSPRTYSESSFLDQRIVGACGECVVLGFRELARLTSSVPPRQLAPHFLAHTSFCCSTLLARTLAFEKRSLVLREPQVVLMLARAFREHPQSFGDRARGAYSRFVLRLLNKAYHPDQRVVLKPSSLANGLLSRWMDMVPDSRGVVLTSSLEDYLVSVLKKTGATRDKMPAVAGALLADAGYPVHSSKLADLRSDYLKAAAVAWHAQQCHLRHLVERHATRLLVCDVGELLTQPVAVVTAVCRQLQLSVSGTEIRVRVEGSLWRRHAKEPSARFDPVVRAAQFSRVKLRHWRRIEATRDWLRRCLDSSPPRQVLPAAAIRSAGAVCESARFHAPGLTEGV